VVWREGYYCSISFGGSLRRHSSHSLPARLVSVAAPLRRYSPPPPPLLRLPSHVPAPASSNQSYLPCERLSTLQAWSKPLQDRSAPRLSDKQELGILRHASLRSVCYVHHLRVAALRILPPLPSMFLFFSNARQIQKKGVLDPFDNHLKSDEDHNRWF